jgi:nucleotide-binding universal stress UspA family protein
MDATAASSLVAEASGVSADPPATASRLAGDCVLAPILTSTGPAVAGQLRVAASLSRASGVPLCVVDPSVETPTEYGPGLSDDAERDLVTRAMRAGRRRSRLGLLRTRTLLNGTLSAIRNNDVGALVIPSSTRSGSLRRNLAEHLGLRASCDVVTVNDRHTDGNLQSILLAVGDGAHSDAAADVARRIATDHDAWIDILHVVSPDAGDDERQHATDHIEAVYDRIDRPERTSTWLLEATDVARAIVEQSEYYGLTVLGAPTKSRLRELVIGSTSRTVRHSANSPVISVRTEG